MMPLSDNGFGPAAILLMVLCLVISQAYKYYRQKSRETMHKSKKNNRIFGHADPSKSNS